MKSLLLTVGCCGLLACSGGAEPGASEVAEAADVEPSERPVPQAEPSEVAEPEVAEPAPFDHALFCRQVFPVGEVARALGQTGLQIQSPNRPPMPGTSECSYARYTDRPVALATAVIDCRPEHPRLSSTVARLLKVDKGRHYRDVDIADGGAYARNERNNNHQELAFVTEEPGCTVYVSTTFVADDRTEVLAQLVDQRLSVDNVPAL